MGKKRTLDELVNEASTEVLGTSNTVPEETALSDSDLLSIFGGAEKKKPSPATSQSQNLVETPQEQNQEQQIIPTVEESNASYKPSGNGSANPSFEEWKASQDFNDRSNQQDIEAYNKEFGIKSEWEQNLSKLSNKSYTDITSQSDTPEGIKALQWLNSNLSKDPQEREKQLSDIQEAQRGRIESAGLNFSRAAANAPAELLEVSAILGKKLEGIIPISTFGDELVGKKPVSELKDSQLIKTAKAYRGMLDELGLQGNKEYKGELATDVIPTVAGQLAVVLTTGGSTKAAKAMVPLVQSSKLAALSTKAANYGIQAVNYAISPPVLTGAIQVGAAEAQQAIQSGASDEQVMEVVLKNMIVGGALEGIPIAHFFKKLNNVTGGGFKDYIKKVAVGGTVQGGMEAITEVLQSAYSNYTAKETYDQTRNIFDGMAEGGGIGFGMGFLLNAMGVSLRNRQKATETPEEQAELQKSIDFVDSKIDDLESGKLTDQGKENSEQLTTPPETINNVQEEQPVNQENVTPENQSTNENIPIENIKPVSEQTTETDNTINPENQTNNIVEPTVEQKDNQNEQRVQSNLGTGKEPITIEPVIEPSKEEASGNRDVQVNEQKGSQNEKQQPIEKSQYKIKKEEQVKKKEIQSRDRLTPHTLARGYFMDGGKVKWDQSESEKLTNKNKSSVKKELNWGNEERKLHAFRMVKEGPSVESIAEKLHEQLPDDLKESFDTNDMRNAVLDVLNENPKEWHGIQDKETNTTSKEEEYLLGNLSKEDAFEYEDWINGNNAQEYFDANSKKLAKEYDEYVNSEEYKSHVNTIQNDTKREGVSNVENQQATGVDSERQLEESRKRISEKTTAIIEQYGNSNESRKSAVEEIKTKDLTHVKGLNMGSNQAEGTYLSAEEQNRYESEDTTTYYAEADISNPFTISNNDFATLQRDVIKENIPFAESIDDLSDSEIQTVSKIITEELKAQGYDSMYTPPTKYQEGELIVFDNSKVKMTEKTPPTKLESEIINHVKDGKSIDDYKEKFGEDFDLVKEYINDTINEQGRTNIGSEGETLEEGKDSNGTESGIGSSLRDKADRLKRTPEGREKRRLAQELLNEVDSAIAEIKAKPEISDKGLSEEGQTKKERSFPKQFDNAGISKEIKEGMTEEGKFYIPITNKLTLKEANYIIQEKGLEQATEDYFDKSNGMYPAVRSMMGELLIKKYNEQVKTATAPEAKEKALNQADRIADDLAIEYTRAGQSIQAASVFARLSPEGILRAIKKEVRKSRNDEIEKQTKKIKDLEEEIKNINRKTVDELFEEKLKPIIEEKAKRSAIKKRKLKVKEVVDFLERLKIKPKPGTLNMAAPIAIPVATYNAAITTMQVSIKAGDMIATAIEKAIKFINSQASSKGWDEKAFREDMTSKFEGYEQVLDPEKIVKNAIKDADINIKELVKKHYTEIDAAKQSLTEKLVKESGLEEQEAAELAKEIRKEFDKIATKKKREYIERQTSKVEKAIYPKLARKKQTAYEKIIDITNQKVLSSKGFEDVYADAFELPKLTVEQVNKITELAEKIQTAKGDIAVNKATQDLLKYQSKLEGIKWGDVGMALWYSNILSGLSTQATNIYSGFSETAGELWTSAIQQKNPKQTAKMAMALFQGYGKGLFNAADILRTGYSPVKSKAVDVQNVLERFQFKGGNWNPYNYSKYVGRLMAAADVFAYAGNKEMRSMQLAQAMAMKEGKDKPTQDIEKRANEILFNTTERVKLAEIQAKEEGLTGNDYKQRVNEIIEESRPEQIEEDAKDFASRATFNYEPEGLLGTMTHGMNYLTNIASIKGIRPLAFVVPFTRVIANVTNRYLDWTPWGFARWKKGGMGYSNPILGDKHIKKYNEEESRRELIKAITGTMGMLAMYALTEPDDEGERAIEITAGGAGDFNTNYELQENGWRPYSIKIVDKWYEYKNTPLAIPFSWVGFYRDSQKYGGEKSPWDKLSIATMGSAKYLMDMNFLASLSGFFSAFSKQQSEGGDFLEKAGKEATKTAKSFVVPNLFTQTSRTYQELAGIPMKKANGILDEIVRDMPVFRDGLTDMYNTLGEPIYPDQNRKYIPFKVKGDENDKVWNLIVENQAWVRIPSKSTLIYDPKLKGERKMTDDEYNKFAVLAGQLTKKSIEDNYNKLSKLPNKSEVQDYVETYKKVARKKAKYGFTLTGKEYDQWHSKMFGKK